MRRIWSSLSLDSSPKRKQEYQRRVNFLLASVLFSFALLITGIILSIGYSYQVLSVVVTQAYPDSPAFALLLALVLSSAGIFITRRLSNLWHITHHFELSRQVYEEDEWPYISPLPTTLLIVYQIPLLKVVADLSKPISRNPDLWTLAHAAWSGTDILPFITLSIVYLTEAGLIAAFVASGLLLTHLAYPYWKGLICAVRRQIFSITVSLMGSDYEKEIENKCKQCWSSEFNLHDNSILLCAYCGKTHAGIGVCAANRDQSN